MKINKRARKAPAVGRDSKVTLGMVASACGVSPSTVSRILNGTAVVSPGKREAVDRAIAALGFIPNPIARGLAGGRTLSVGVVTQAIDSPFYGVALRGIEEELGKVGYSPLFVSGHWNADEEKRCIDVLLSRRVDGVIILTGRLSDNALLNLSRSMPVVVTGRNLLAPSLYSLRFDNFKGAQLATQHLLTLGHRRIAFIAGSPPHPDATERLRGYRAALKSANVPYNPALVLPGAYLEESGLSAVERLIDSGEPFTAIFAANDQMAFGAALALHRRGLHVPNDISLVGFDNLVGAVHSIPPLSTVDQSPYELGRLAALSLLKLLAGETPTSSLSEPRLILRSSTRAIGEAEVELRISAIAFEAQNGMIVTAPDGVIQRVNTAFTRLTGYSAEEAVGQTPGGLLKSGRQDNAFYQRMWAALKDNGRWAGEIWNKRKNGEIYAEMLSIEAIGTPSQPIIHYVASFSEITKK